MWQVPLDLRVLCVDLLDRLASKDLLGFRDLLHIQVPLDPRLRPLDPGDPRVFRGLRQIRDPRASPGQQGKQVPRASRVQQDKQVPRVRQERQAHEDRQVALDQLALPVSRVLWATLVRSVQLDL